MNKLFTKILFGVLTVFLFAGTSFAANSTSIRLQQPQSPTNQDTFNVIFVALDTNSSQPVSVQCYKKGPSDGSFVTFGSAINLTNGGNTNNCEVYGGIMNQGSGTYQFEAVASGSTNPTSNIVSVNFNNSANPGAPENYSKTKQDNCTYKISFKTADDSGKTIKVILYRSDQTSFNVDSGHQVNSINIGSNTEGSMTDNISPNCDKTYYYAIRAFDVYGNGSDVRGDSSVTTTIINPTVTSSPVQGAIPVSASGVGATTGVLGETTGKEGVESEKEVLGATESAEASITPEVVNLTPQGFVNPISWVLTHKKISLLVLIALAAIARLLYRRRQKKV